MNPYPIVSVIITNYHKQKYICEAIDSVIGQTFKDFEIHIMDDSNGADDIKNLINKYDSIYIHETNDIGLSALRNKAAEFALGKYILFLDGDDKIHPEFLSKTVSVLERDKNISFVYTDTQHFDGAETFWEQPEYNFYNLIFQNYICSCSLIRLKDMFCAGGFDESNFNYWEDYEFWIAMGSKGYYGKHIPEKLFYYRIHPQSGMQSKRNEMLSILYKSYIVDKFKVLYPIEWQKEAVRILSQYPPDIMKWKPEEQEKYLKEKGLINE